MQRCSNISYDSNIKAAWRLAVKTHNPRSSDKSRRRGSPFRICCVQRGHQAPEEHPIPLEAQPLRATGGLL